MTNLPWTLVVFTFDYLTLRFNQQFSSVCPKRAVGNSAVDPGRSWNFITADFRPGMLVFEWNLSSWRIRIFNYYIDWGEPGYRRYLRGKDEGALYTTTSCIHWPYASGSFFFSSNHQLVKAKVDRYLESKVLIWRVGPFIAMLLHCKI